VHRVLFRIPMPFGLEPLEIASYGCMVALGALVGIYIASVRARRAGINPNLILDLALVIILSGLIGARLFFFIFDDWSEFTSSGVGHALKQFINFPSGGLSFYGALALGIPAGIIFLHTRMKHIWAVGDIAMPSIALGIAFARIGCYLNGCCFGKPCAASFPLAQYFPLHQGSGLSIPAQHYLSKGMAEWPVPIYPTQLISSLNAFVLFIVLSMLINRRRFDGQLFCLFGIWYGISRFLIEFLRGDNARTAFGVLTTWQLAGLLLAPACAVLWIVFQRRGRLTPLAA
jgi:phosphatidylglycerol:prolipoprotein diacylglycerol transferase